MDLNVTPNNEIAKWSETRFFGCWNPDAGVGIYAHMGRFRRDLDMWWVHVAAYLPDGLLAVDRTWGRTGDPAQVRTGTFLLQQAEDGFSTTYDGVAELATTAQLAAGPRGAGARMTELRWEARFTGLSPTWDMYGGDESKHEFAGDSHTQRSFTTTGKLTANGTTHALDGVGWRDHSSGVRAWDGYGSHRFVLGVMPDYSVHAIMLYGPNGEPKGPIGDVFYRDGRQARVVRFDMPPMTDALGGPDDGEFVLQADGGEPVTLRYEILHQCPIVINDEGENMNGIDWERTDTTTLVLGEAAARLTDPDGAVGHCFHERGVIRDELERPAAS